ncbi:hypothetical protein ES702_02002 [subsurface metagenome]
MEGKKVSIKKSTISMSQTAGLTSIMQLIDSTANDIFNFKDSTSQTGDILVTFSPSYQEHEQGVEE